MVLKYSFILVFGFYFLMDISLQAQCLPSPPPFTIWGQNTGEGDFNGGLNGWTVDTEEGKGWEWTPVGDCASNFTPMPCFMQTPTICNGAVMMDIAKLETNGGCQATCITSLFSPNINLKSSGENNLSVQFNQTIRDFNSKYFLITSYDDGFTWPDSIPINDDLFRNQDIILNQQKRIGLCNTPADAKSIRLQFLIKADYYFWGIDDVFLIDEAFEDAAINMKNYTIVPPFKTPIGLLDEFPLFATVNNVGNRDIEELSIEATISKITLQNGQVLFGEVLTKNEIYKQIKKIELPRCSGNKTIVFDENYKSSIMEEGLYQLDFIVKSKENKITENDKQFSLFMVSKNTMSNGPRESEFGSAYLQSRILGLDLDWMGSNYMTTVSIYHLPIGKPSRATNFVFGMDDSKIKPNNVKATITCNIYRLIKNTNTNEIGVDEKILVGRGYNEFGGDSLYFDENTVAQRFYQFYLKDIDGKDLMLDGNNSYLFCLNVSANVTARKVPLLQILAKNDLSTNWFNASSTDQQLKAQNRYKYTGNFTSKPFGPISPDVNERVFYPATSAQLYSEVVFDDGLIGVKEEKNTGHEIVLYPNPANSELHILQSNENIDVRIFDIHSKAVFKAALNKNEHIDVTPFQNGIYLLEVFNGHTYSTRSFLIQH